MTKGTFIETGDHKKYRAKGETDSSAVLAVAHATAR